MTFETFQTLFVVAILIFMAFVGLQILVMRERHAQPPRGGKPASQPSEGTRSPETEGTWGISGISASDVSTSLSQPSFGATESSDCDPGDIGDTGGGGWND